MDTPKKGPEKNQITLDFQPITQGLGFHPFSDGMPYAPIGKTQNSPQKKSSLGSGATAAGRPSFATTAPKMTQGTSTALTPARPAARISVPVARPAYQPQVPGKLKTTVQPNHSASLIQPAALASPELAAQLALHFGFGYMLKRSFAYLIDSIFNIGLCVGALSAALWKQDLSPELLLTPGVALVSILFLTLFNWAMTTAQEVAFGTSVGKRMFRLALNGSTSAIFLRAFFFLPSVGFGGIGLLWALFDSRKRCWHDLVVDLQPIEIARL